LLTEEEKERIRKDHRAQLEKKHRDIEGRVVEQEQMTVDKAVEDEIAAIHREEEDRFYKDKPDYVKVKDRYGNVRWMTKSEFEEKRYRKYKVRKKRKHRSSRKILERLSVILIIVAMIIIAIVAYRAVS
jgi:hypothetical protein